MRKSIIFIALFLFVGCATRTVYVPHGQAVRLRQPVKNVKVWVKTKDGSTEPSKMDIPEGWFCLPLGGGDNGQ